MARITNQEYVHGNLSSICQIQSGQFYFLATEVITLKNGDKTNIYQWLPKNHDLKSGQVACIMPDGYFVAESSQGIPVLKEN